MNKHKLLSTMVFILFFTGVFAQETTIENTQLHLENDNLIITYDVVGTKALDNVLLDIQTTSGKIIIARNLSGDIGRSIPVGKGKKISWNMKTDGVDLQGEELNVKVLAAKPSPSIYTLTEIAEIEKGKQNKKRDKIIFKEGNSLKGRLNRRFAPNNLKFISSDGNAITINPDDIKEIKNNDYMSRDSVLLKNGDIICGRISKIYPNDKIILVSKNNFDKYLIHVADIKSVITY